MIGRGRFTRRKGYVVGSTNGRNHTAQRLVTNHESREAIEFSLEELRKLEHAKAAARRLVESCQLTPEAVRRIVSKPSDPETIDYQVTRALSRKYAEARKNPPAWAKKP